MKLLVLKSIRIKSLNLLLILFFINISSTFSQLTVTNGGSLGLTPLQLVQQYLVGAGITVSNARFNGSTAILSSNMLGTYTATGPAQTQLGFPGGIIITSGTASIAIGPNNSPSAGSAVGTGSDPDLALLIPGYTVYDKAVLEFDFIPISDTIHFRYVFGSEEFDEYCNSTFNDVFGFFVSGPGISGSFSNNSINIALMPNSTNYVTINNVCNTPGVSWSNAGGLYFQYDRLTNVYTAMCVVQPCQTYHLKLAIGDAGDQAFDSGVFFELNSFSSNGVSYNTHYTSHIDTVAVEGCNNAVISFILNHPAQDTVVINYTIGGTATEGVDYPSLPDSLVILPGQDSAALMIIPISDGLVEPWESVILSYVNTVCGSLDTILIWIKDYDSISATVTPDVHICTGDSAYLNVLATGGYPPLHYLWSNSDTLMSTVVKPATPTEYHVSVSDACHFATIDSVKVSISDLSSQLTSVDSVTCHDYHNGSVTVTEFNGLPGFHYHWNTGDTTATIDSLFSGNYIVTVTDGIGCTSTNSVTLNNPLLIQVQLTPTDETCLNSCNGQVQSNIVANPYPPYVYTWSTNPAQTGATAMNLCPGTYNLTLTYSPNNCYVTATSNVSTSTLIQANFTANPTQGFVPFNVDFTFTGYGASTYHWDLGDGTISTVMNPSHTYSTMGIYTVILIINSGPPDNCIDTAKFIITAVQPSSIVVPNVFTPNDDGHNDFLTVKSEGIKSFKIEIFNRWGKKVYEDKVDNDFSEQMTNTDLWNGNDMHGGAKCSDGTYFYIIEATGYDTKTYNLNGTITLMR